jgi:hypothetical protein
MIAHTDLSSAFFPYLVTPTDFTLFLMQFSLRNFGRSLRLIDYISDRRLFSWETNVSYIATECLKLKVWIFQGTHYFIP